jgi:hypothetical protein
MAAVMIFLPVLLADAVVELLRAGKLAVALDEVALEVEIFLAGEDGLSNSDDEERLLAHNVDSKMLGSKGLVTTVGAVWEFFIVWNSRFRSSASSRLKPYTSMDRLNSTIFLSRLADASFSYSSSK